jgi:hypothetical protein
MKSEKPAGKRFLIPKAPKGGRNNREITRADIAQAVRAFQQSGGLIKQLPSQADERRTQVGNHRDSMYEAVLDLN